MYIDWKTYKHHTKQEVLPGDEDFDSIIMNFDEELVYKTEEVLTIKDKKKKIRQSTMKICKNCHNTNQKELKIKSIYGVKSVLCLSC